MYDDYAHTIGRAYSTIIISYLSIIQSMAIKLKNKQRFLACSYNHLGQIPPPPPPPHTHTHTCLFDSSIRYCSSVPQLGSVSLARLLHCHSLGCTGDSGPGLLQREVDRPGEGKVFVYHCNKKIAYTHIRILLTKLHNKSQWANFFIGQICWRGQAYNV